MVLEKYKTDLVIQKLIQIKVGESFLSIMLHRFREFIFSFDGIIVPPSMEKFWLAFVMKELYNKIWNQITKEWKINKREEYTYG